MSHLRRFRLPALVVLVAVLGAACGRDAVAASLDGDEITRGELLEILDGDPSTALGGGYDRQSAADVLEVWLLFEALNDEVERRGEQVTDDDETAALAALPERFPDVDPDSTLGRFLARQQAIADAAQRLIVRELPEPTAEVYPPAYLCSSHVLVETEDEARAVLGRLADGEDFADVARDVSIDPGSSQRGGDIGCNPEGSLVPEYEAAAYLAEPGDVVGPVQSQFGWHVIEVRSVGPGTAEVHPDLDADTADRILADAVDRELQAERNRFVTILRDAALDAAADRVEVDRRYGVWNPDTRSIDPTALPSPPATGTPSP